MGSYCPFEPASWGCYLEIILTSVILSHEFPLFEFCSKKNVYTLQDVKKYDTRRIC